MRQLLPFVILFFMIGQVSAQTTWLVENTSDAASPVSGQHTLRSAIGAATSGDIIEFATSTNGLAIVFGSEIAVNKELTIKGNGSVNTVLDGNNATRMFTISSPLYLEGVTVRNAYFAGAGGAIHTTNSITVKSCVFTGNSSQIVGGGIWVNLSNAVNAKVLIDDCTFAGNSATYGGAMYLVLLSGNADFTIKNTKLRSNTASGYGGAIYAFGVDADFTMVNTDVIGNVADQFGGGLYFDGLKSATITNSAILNNRSIISDGGGINLRGFSLYLNNSTVAGNQANVRAGGICTFASVTGTPTEVHFSNSIVAKNQASTHPDIQSPAGVNTVLNGGNFIGINTGLSTINGTNLLGTTSNPIDPLFVNLAGHDARLTACSPAINIGDNALIPQDDLDVDGDGNTTETIDIDLNSQARIYGTTNVDAGAYEFQSQLINGAPNPFFYYPNGQNYCQNTGTTLPVAAAGGTFSVVGGNPSQISWNNSTGAIDLDNSSPGTYTIQHTLADCSGNLMSATFTITILPAGTTVLNVTICDGDSYTLGCDTYTTSGTYTHTTFNANGCEETTVVNLTVAPNPTITVNQVMTGSGLTQRVGKLVAVGAGGSGNYSYVWMDNGTVVSTEPELDDPCSGVAYTVTVTDLTTGCETTIPYSFYHQMNLCKVIIDKDLSLGGKSAGLGLVLYPNPNEGQFRLQGDRFKIAHFMIYDDAGTVLVNRTVTESEHLEINLQNAKKGIYLIKAFDKSGQAIDKRFVIN